MNYAPLFGVEWTGKYNLKQVEVMPPLDTDLKNPMDLQDPGIGTFGLWAWRL